MLIHVLPGDAVVESFKESGIEGEMVVCRECLVEGDVKAENIESFWRVRAEFIKDTYKDSDNSYFEKVAGELKKLQNMPDGGEVNLWFEYELFCQANMWFCLWLLSEKRVDIYRVEPISRTEEDLWKGFGKFGGEELRRCFDRRTKFSEADRLLGKNLWEAYQNKVFEKLKELSLTDSKCFPKLKEVCEAEIEKQTRPKKTLEKIVSTGETDFGRIFQQFSAAEGVYGFGDTQVKRILQEI